MGNWQGVIGGQGVGLDGALGVGQAPVATRPGGAAVPASPPATVCRAAAAGGGGGLGRGSGAGGARRTSAGRRGAGRASGGRGARQRRARKPPRCWRRRRGRRQPGAAAAAAPRGTRGPQRRGLAARTASAQSASASGGPGGAPITSGAGGAGGGRGARGAGASTSARGVIDAGAAGERQGSRSGQALAASAFVQAKGWLESLQAVAEGEAVEKLQQSVSLFGKAVGTICDQINKKTGQRRGEVNRQKQVADQRVTKLEKQMAEFLEVSHCIRQRRCERGDVIASLQVPTQARDSPGQVGSASGAMARSQRGGSSGRRSRAYWMRSCRCWNWDWRFACLSCGHAAPPWAAEAPRGKAKPEVDKDGWVDQPRGRQAQQQARSAASRTASTKSQTSASAASGAPSNGGATAIERLRATVERLETLQAGPPDGVDCCFTDVVANQLEAKRAELAIAQKEAAEQKASAMPRSALLRKEANAIGKEEKRLRAARQALEQKQAARDLAEVQLQKAQDELAALDGEVEEASKALQVLGEAAREEAEKRRRQRAAEWAGASHVPGLLTQLDKLPEAWGSSNFEVAWAAMRSQVEAARAQLAAAAERGQAERHGSARGEWPQVSQACKRELVAEAADLADGGVRPIVNSPPPMRIWGSPRQPTSALWEAERDHRLLGGKMARKCYKAGWRRSARAAVAACVRERRCASASLCLDITRLYENQRHASLWQWGVEHGFDLRARRGMHVLYQAGAGERRAGISSVRPCKPGTSSWAPPLRGVKCMRTVCGALEPCAVSAGCPRSWHPRGPQGAPPPSAPWRGRSPHQAAKDSEGLTAWRLATFAGPVAEEVNIDGSSIVTCLRSGRSCATAPSRATVHLWGRILEYLEPGTFEDEKVPAHGSRQAVPDGPLAEAHRRALEHADRLAKVGAQMQAVDRQTGGEHHTRAETVLELRRWILRAAIFWHIGTKDCEGLPPAAERRQVRFAAAEAPQAAEEAASAEPRARRPRLGSARSAGSSSAALSASASAFSILGRALSYACTGEGDAGPELLACTKCDTYVTLGGRAERCPGDKADQWGQDPSQPLAARPEMAQERHLVWRASQRSAAADPSAAASTAGSAPAAAAAPVEVGAAASLPLRRPAAARAGLRGAFVVAKKGRRRMHAVAVRRDRDKALCSSSAAAFLFTMGALIREGAAPAAAEQENVGTAELWLAFGAAWARHGGDVLLACQHVLVRLYPHDSEVCARASPREMSGRAAVSQLSPPAAPLAQSGSAQPAESRTAPPLAAFRREPPGRRCGRRPLLAAAAPGAPGRRDHPQPLAAPLAVATLGNDVRAAAAVGSFRWEKQCVRSSPSPTSARSSPPPLRSSAAASPSGGIQTAHARASRTRARTGWPRCPQGSSGPTARCSAGTTGGVSTGTASARWCRCPLPRTDSTDRICSMTRTRASSFPTQVAAGLLWVWLDSSPEAWVESAAAQAPMAEALRSAGWSFQLERRSHESLIEECLRAPAPGPEGRVAAGAAWAAGEAEVSERGVAYSQRLGHGDGRCIRQFTPPCCVSLRRDLPGSGAPLEAAFYLVPVGPEETRVIFSFPDFGPPPPAADAQDPLADLLYAAQRARGEGLWRFGARDDGDWEARAAVNRWLDGAGRPFDAAATAGTEVPLGPSPAGPEGAERWRQHCGHCPRCQRALQLAESLRAGCASASAAALLVAAVLGLAGSAGPGALVLAAAAALEAVAQGAVGLQERCP
ncbi:unnamed protein product [Prorocentrum cordatum]|uniref:Uncharacterized protein n=1 Tax=Prorocentrum cordatum TaxID=2364126 RepID=A0ABN9WXN9_9DINO|nr:unnamed protein product [Polarella glacialis]